MSAREFWSSTSPPPKAGDHPTHTSVNDDDNLSIPVAQDRLKQSLKSLKNADKIDKNDEAVDASDTQRMRTKKLVNDTADQATHDINQLRFARGRSVRSDHL